MEVFSCSKIPPEDFTPYVSAVGCVVEKSGQILFLQRSLGSACPSVWGIPGGKIEEGETPQEAVVRELFEETAITMELEKLSPVVTLFIKKPQGHYPYHMFFYPCEELCKVLLSDEHVAYKWVSLEQMSRFSLIVGSQETMAIFEEERKRLGIR